MPTNRVLMPESAVVNGAEGECYIKRDGKWLNLMNVTQLDASYDINKESFGRLGTRQKAHKITSVEGSGSFTIQAVTSMFLEMMQNYLDNGTPISFDMQVINYDPGSGIGTQDVILKNCTMDSVPVTKLDVDDSLLNQDYDFTFDGLETNSVYNVIEGVGDAAR